jgi:hypothetical protein
MPLPPRWPSRSAPPGNVTPETLRAFTEDEYRQIVAALP